MTPDGAGSLSARVAGGWQRLSANHRGALWMIAASLGFTNGLRLRIGAVLSPVLSSAVTK